MHNMHYLNNFAMNIYSNKNVLMLKIALETVSIRIIFSSFITILMRI